MIVVLIKVYHFALQELLTTFTTVPSVTFVCAEADNGGRVVTAKTNRVRQQRPLFYEPSTIAMLIAAAAILGTSCQGAVAVDGGGLPAPASSRELKNLSL